MVRWSGLGWLGGVGIFYLGFTARQDYFTHFEASQSLGRAET